MLPSKKEMSAAGAKGRCVGSGCVRVVTLSGSTAVQPADDALLGRCGRARANNGSGAVCGVWETHKSWTSRKGNPQDEQRCHGGDRYVAPTR